LRWGHHLPTSLIPAGEETARLALESTAAEAAAALETARGAVATEAKKRVAAETKAAELADQKRILVREVERGARRDQLYFNVPRIRQRSRETLGDSVCRKNEKVSADVRRMVSRERGP